MTKAEMLGKIEHIAESSINEETKLEALKILLEHEVEKEKSKRNNEIVKYMAEGFLS